MRCRAPSGIEGVERLALRVDADVRVVLQHPARQVAADRFEHVISHAHLGQLGDDRVPEIVEAQALQAGLVTERPPGRIPLQHRLRRIVSPPLAGRPEVMPWLSVPEQISAFEHTRHCFNRRGSQRNNAMARLVLAPPNVQQSLEEIFYRIGDRMMAVNVTMAGDDFQLSTPKQLFARPYAFGRASPSRITT